MSQKDDTTMQISPTTVSDIYICVCACVNQY